MACSSCKKALQLPKITDPGVFQSPPLFHTWLIPTPPPRFSFFLFLSVVPRLFTLQCYECSHHTRRILTARMSTGEYAEAQTVDVEKATLLVSQSRADVEKVNLLDAADNGRETEKARPGQSGQSGNQPVAAFHANSADIERPHTERTIESNVSGGATAGAPTPPGAVQGGGIRWCTGPVSRPSAAMFVFFGLFVCVAFMDQQLQLVSHQPSRISGSVPPRPLDNDIITEDDLQEQVCDFGFRTRRRNDLKQGSQLKALSVICTMGDESTLQAFFGTIVPTIEFGFTLVTVEHDDSIPHKRIWLETPRLLAWYGWNVAFVHPKLHALPIGLNKGRHLANVLRARQSAVPKNGRVLINFNLDREERRSIWELSKEWGTLVDRVPYDASGKSSAGTVGAVSGSSYYDLLSNYSYVVCPQGLGIDTHRAWEAMYLGAIPIVRKSSISELFEDLPVIQLERWKDFGLRPLKSRVERLPSSGDKLRLSTWVKEIKASPGKAMAQKSRVIRFRLGVAGLVGLIIFYQRIVAGRIGHRQYAAVQPLDNSASAADG